MFEYIGKSITVTVLLTIVLGLTALLISALGFEQVKFVSSTFFCGVVGGVFSVAIAKIVHGD